MSQRSLRAVGTAALLVAASSVALATPALAGTYVHRSCADGARVADGWTPYLSVDGSVFPRTYTSSGCADSGGLHIQFGGSDAAQIGSGLGAGWRYGAPSGTTVAAVDMFQLGWVSSNPWGSSAVRVVADEFAPSSTQKRNMKRNADLQVSLCRPWSTAEQFELLQRYLGVRHPGGGMASMDETDFADMVEHTPVTSYIVEYREPSVDGVTPGRLVGACLTDKQADGLSMIYSFYEPDHDSRSGLGNYIILDHIRRAAAEGLPFVYLGYWVEGSARMQYKVRYRPLERLSRDGWVRLGDAEHDRLIAQAAAMRRSDADPLDGSTKDGAHGGQVQYRVES